MDIILPNTALTIPHLVSLYWSQVLLSFTSWSLAATASQPPLLYQCRFSDRVGTWVYGMVDMMGVL